MKIKKILILLLIITCVSTFIFSNRGLSTAYASDVEQKIYCEIDENVEFTDDRVFVILTNKASLTSKRYTASDFAEIPCSEVVDLTEPLWQKVINHEHTIGCNPNI